MNVMDVEVCSGVTDAGGIYATGAGRQAQDAFQRDSGRHSSGGRWMTGTNTIMDGQRNRKGRNESTSRDVGDAS